MNKYSKRALKTTATVGMSLAMVLSAAAPVMAATTNGDSANHEIRTSTENDALITVRTVKSAMESAKIALAETDKEGWSTLNSESEIKIAVEGTTTDTKATVYTWVTENAVEFANVSILESDYDFAQKVTKIMKETTDINTAVSADKGHVADGGKWSVASLNDTTAPTAYTELEKLEDFVAGDYFVNLTTDEADDLQYVIDTLTMNLEEKFGDTYGETYDAYSTQLDKDMEAFKKEQTQTSDKALIKKVIARITKGEEVPASGVFNNTQYTKSNYKKYLNEDAVSLAVEELNTMLDDIADVELAVNKTKSDSYKSYLEGGTKSVKSKMATWSGNDIDAADGVLKNIKTTEYEVLKAFKEDVIDLVWNFETKETSTSFLNKSGLAATAKETTVRTALKEFDNSSATKDGILLGNFDKKEGTFGWDTLAEHMDKVNTSLATIEKDLAKLDAITLLASDRATLVAADDAVYFLQKDAEKNLSSAQTRTVRDASRKVTELMETYRVKFGSIDSTINGWVNKGNGDWAYYEEGAAVTKWVAAGTNWYYVKDGAMLRNSWIANNSTGSKWYYVDNAGVMVSNTTVNGYNFDANGVWVK